MSKIEIAVLFDCRKEEFHAVIGGLTTRRGKLIAATNARREERFFRHADRIYKVLAKLGNVRASYHE